MDGGNEACNEMEDDDEDWESDEENCMDDGQVVSKKYQTSEKQGELVRDETAYVVYHQVTTGAPCLSFDIIRDTLGEDRANQYPLTAYLVAGTQAQRTHVNNIIVMKMSNMSKTKIKRDSETEDSGSSSSEDEDEKPELEAALVRHQGCVNRIRTTLLGGRPITASWSETGKVYLWDLSHPLCAVNNPQAMANYVRNDESPKPLFSFAGHQTEGYAVDWSSTNPGMLATGDCNKNIHLWKPQAGGTWHVDQRPYSAHTASVEDLQWSPNEANVLASCSVDKSIRIWDTRAPANKACMLTTENAHELDVNVISWNHSEPFIVSGGDDGILKVWDLRQMQEGKPVVVFKHHVAPVTSVEWHPTDSTVFAVSGADDQVTLWDLAVERDTEADGEEEEVPNLPPQLLFIHQGQKEVKELHWHPQIPGLIISTAQTGFNVFRTISV